MDEYCTLLKIKLTLSPVVLYLGSPPREQEEWVKVRMKGIPSLFDIKTFAPGESPQKPPPKSQAQSSPSMQR